MARSRHPTGGNSAAARIIDANLVGSMHGPGKTSTVSTHEGLVYAVEISDGGVNCTSPSRGDAGDQTVRVSLNGQQFTDVGPFGYYKTATIATGIISPSSGSSTGNTTVTVRPAALRLSGGSDYRCSFGTHGVVPAWYDNENGTIVCLSPSGARSDQPFTVTRNGQQYAESDAIFTFVGTPHLTATLPLSGPQEGGTVVAFTGPDLTNGSHYICWCEDDYNPAYVDGVHHVTTWEEGADEAPLSPSRVLCTMPPSQRSCDPYGRCLSRKGNTTCRISSTVSSILMRLAIYITRRPMSPLAALHAVQQMVGRLYMYMVSDSVMALIIYAHSVRGV